MIPQRVRLRGFLCYKDEQAIDFDGNATLWMLSGLNGSGKSAIFDAVTYALFGHHRGGGSQAYELINKDSDTLLVEFDFLLDGKAYRAKRTLKRDTKGGARGTQQMFWLSGDDWVPVPDTGQKSEFTRWVAENIGLTYETFTSSVLLLQGKAERLLDSKPEGRREVLASIVDLGRYERLHGKADEKRKALDGERKALEGRLAALPAVEPLEVEEARSRIADAEAARASARERVERLLGVEATVREWQNTKQRLGQARTRWEKARGVLAEAASIEQAVERLRELREVLPRLQELSVLRQQANQAEEQAKHYQRERERHAEALAQKDAALRQARDKRATLQGQLTRDTDAHRELNTKLRVSEKLLVTLKEGERQEAERERLREELSRLPGDPGALLAEARAEYDRLDALDRMLPVLQRFASRRDEVRRSAEQEVAAEAHMRQVRERGEGLKAEMEQLAPRVEEAARELLAANDAATEARTILTQARQSLAELQQIDGAKVCRHCGQALTANHIEDEKRRRSKAVKEAEVVAKQACAALEVAKRRDAEVRQRHGGGEGGLRGGPCRVQGLQHAAEGGQGGGRARPTGVRRHLGRAAAGAPHPGLPRPRCRLAGDGLPGGEGPRRAERPAARARAGPPQAARGGAAGAAARPADGARVACAGDPQPDAARPAVRPRGGSAPARRAGRARAGAEQEHRRRPAAGRRGGAGDRAAGARARAGPGRGRPRRGEVERAADGARERRARLRQPGQAAAASLAGAGGVGRLQGDARPARRAGPSGGRGR